MIINVLDGEIWQYGLVANYEIIILQIINVYFRKKLILIMLLNHCDIFLL